MTRMRVTLSTAYGSSLFSSLHFSSSAMVTPSTGGSNRHHTNRKWTLPHAVLAVLVLLLSLQTMTRHWNSVTFGQFNPPVLVASLTSSGTSRRTSNSKETTNNHSLWTMSKDRAKSGEANHVSTKSNTGILQPGKLLWEGIEALRHIAATYCKGGNIFCTAIDEVRQNDSSIPLTLEISFGCDELFHKSGFGTGNYIAIVYGLRLASAVHTNVGLNLTCHDANTTSKDLILPWLTGWFPPRSTGSENPFPKVSTKEACGAFPHAKMSLLYRETIQFDFRRMAIGLVGLPDDPNHPSVQFAKTYLSSRTRLDKNITFDPSVRQLVVTPNKPVFPKGSVQLDDAVIHFRCGDLMNSVSPHYAFLKFQSYVNDISSAARTIGVITQPFPPTNTQTGPDGNGTAMDPTAIIQSRWLDGSVTTQDRCRTVVLALVDYIQVRHPQSRVTIHNGPNETIALAYARMVMANQTIAGISSFGVFPVLSTFGTGYLYQPEGSFANSVMFRSRLDELATNLHIISDADHIMVAEIKKLWETQGAEGVLARFKEEVTTG